MDVTVPLRRATGELRELLICLAERYADDPTRPTCDGETTLADWIATGHYDG